MVFSQVRFAAWRLRANARAPEAAIQSPFQAPARAVSEHSKRQLDRHFAWFEARLSPRLARFVGWLRKPSSRFVRIPLAILLIFGGIFSFLPVLGLWMLPLGLVLFAQGPAVS
jgi:hypothetical protein